MMNAASIEQAAQQADDRRVAALLTQDYDALAALLSDKLVYHRASGKVDSKESYLAQFRERKVRFVGCQRLDASIAVVGDTAICRGIARNDLW
jgi:hypothetical protein